jgi:hypothetical protein
VYNSRFDSLGYDPNDPGGLLPTSYRRTLDRAVLAKFTYMFDY